MSIASETLGSCPLLSHVLNEKCIRLIELLRLSQYMKNQIPCYIIFFNIQFIA
jgi:hypothetical protein